MQQTEMEKLKYVAMTSEVTELLGQSSFYQKGAEHKGN